MPCREAAGGRRSPAALAVERPPRLACRDLPSHMRWLLRLVEAAGKEGASGAASIRSHRYTKGEEETSSPPPGLPAGKGTRPVPRETGGECARGGAGGKRERTANRPRRAPPAPARRGPAAPGIARTEPRTGRNSANSPGRSIDGRRPPRGLLPPSAAPPPPETLTRRRPPQTSRWAKPVWRPETPRSGRPGGSRGRAAPPSPAAGGFPRESPQNRRR